MSKFFINRPIVAIVISILMVIVGIVAMLGLPTAQFPNIVPPEMQVTGTYPGADALTIEQSVATPIEQQMSGVDNMNYMYSLNSNDGKMSLTVNFDVKTDPSTDQILAQMRSGSGELAAARRRDQPGRNGAEVNLCAADHVCPLFPQGHLRQRLSGQLQLYQHQRPDDPRAGNRERHHFRRRAVRHAPLGEARSACQARHHHPRDRQRRAAAEHRKSRRPGRRRAGAAGPGIHLCRSLPGPSPEPNRSSANIVIRANSDGSLVRLKDVGRIELGAQSYNMIGRLNGKPAAIIALYQMPGTNAIEAADGAKKLMAQLKERFPADLDYVVALDTTLAVTEGIKEIVKTLYEALILVIIVVFIFLQGWRSTLIPLLAVPVSLVGTFMLFPLFGFSINTLSLFGLVLAIGLVVDDAIVVVEAVEHHIEQGMSPKEATLKAMEEVSGPVIAIAVILAAVFIPTAFIPGITGRLYQQFAVTIAVSVIISAFNALTLSPALSAMLLRPKKKAWGPLQKFYDWFNRFFGRATDGYVNWCDHLIRKSKMSLLFLLGTVVLAGLFGKTSAGLLPA